MPVTWTMSPKDRLIVAVARGELKAADIETYLSEVTAAGGMAYRKIFDVTHATIGEIDKQALVSLGKRVSDYGLSGKLGAIAIVARSDASYEAAQIYAANAVASRPIQIFRELHHARAWLDPGWRVASVDQQEEVVTFTRT